jgi:predicted peptidase
MVHSGKQAAQVMKRDTTIDLPYLLYLPDGYEQKGKLWPLLLFLHGSGERGSNLQLVKTHGPPKHVDKGRAYPFIIASPQCPVEHWWSFATLDLLLREIVEKYGVDENRIYVTGLSMGGFATWTLATEYPGRFAAIVPICGGGIPHRASLLSNLPIWAFHGAQDPVIPLLYSQEMVNAVNAAGGSATLTIYPDAGHDAWTETYDNPELYEWLMRQSLRQDQTSE